MRFYLLVLFTCLMFPARVEATIHLIRPDGAGDFSTIQAAINAASDGDTVGLAAGTYSGSGNRDIDFLGKGIVVRSVDGAWSTCIIACAGSPAAPRRGFTFHCGEDTTSVLEGVTISSGWAATVPFPSGGGGILCEAASPKILRCRVANCISDYGGGLFTHAGSPVLVDCVFDWNEGHTNSGRGAAVFAYEGDLSVRGGVFSGNCAANGGAVAAEWAGVHIDHSLFSSNTAYGDGGAIHVEHCSPLELVSCLFQENTSQHGGAVLAGTSDLSVVGTTFARNFALNSGGGITIRGNANHLVNSCTFSENLADIGGAMFFGDPCSPLVNNTMIAFSIDGGGVRFEPIADPSFECCDIYGNWGGDWTGPLASQFGVSGNFSADPCFCDAENDDYHLWNYSPCAQVGCGTIGAWPVGCWDAQELRDGMVTGARTERLYLSRCSPNPFTHSAMITYILPEPTAVRLAVYDAGGRLLRTLVEGVRPAGEQAVAWNGTDDSGRGLASGTYFCRLEGLGCSFVKRIHLVR